MKTTSLIFCDDELELSDFLISQTMCLTVNLTSSTFILNEKSVLFFSLLRGVFYMQSRAKEPQVWMFLLSRLAMKYP
jgi:hypothetical protein